MKNESTYPVDSLYIKPEHAGRVRGYDVESDQFGKVLSKKKDAYVTPDEGPKLYVRTKTDIRPIPAEVVECQQRHIAKKMMETAKKSGIIIDPESIIGPVSIVLSKEIVKKGDEIETSGKKLERISEWLIEIFEEIISDFKQSNFGMEKEDSFVIDEDKNKLASILSNGYQLLHISRELLGKVGLGLELQNPDKLNEDQQRSYWIRRAYMQTFARACIDRFNKILEEYSLNEICDSSLPDKTIIIPAIVFSDNGLEVKLKTFIDHLAAVDSEFADKIPHYDVEIIQKD